MGSKEGARLDSCQCSRHAAGRQLSGENGMTSNRMGRVAGSAALLSVLASTAHAAADFSGVWGMIQHDRLGAPFFNQVEQSVLKRLPDVSY